MDVGIRNLKAHLSEHLERVANGEVITVTSRGRRVAQIVPVLGRDNLDRGLAEGWVTRQVERPPEPVLRQRPLGGTPTTTELISQDPGRVTLYVDSSALIKRYVAEDDSEAAEAILLSDADWVTGRHTFVEVSLAISRRLGEAERRVASAALDSDWQRTFIVALDEVVCRRAAELGIATGSRSFDALHLAAAERAGGRSVAIVTFDVRLGQAARSLGFAVIGA